MTALAPILQAYFTQRLAQRQASAHTVASYRDTFSLLLRFAQQQLGTPPSRLDLADVDAALVGAFLDHLETGRGNSAATPATTASPRSTPCSPTRRCAAPNTPRPSPGSWRSPRNAPTPPSSASSPRTRSKRCWPARTGPPDPADATTRCCSWRSKPACASPSSPD